jgi:hypothetical protein
MCDAKRYKAQVAKTARHRRAERNKPQTVQSDMHPSRMQQGVGDGRPPERPAVTEKQPVDFDLRGARTLRRIEYLGDPIRIQGEREPPRHESEVCQQRNVLFIRQKLAQRVDADEERDKGDHDGRDVENLLSPSHRAALPLFDVARERHD